MSAGCRLGSAAKSLLAVSIWNWCKTSGQPNRLQSPPTAQPLDLTAATLFHLVMRLKKPLQHLLAEEALPVVSKLSDERPQKIFLVLLLAGAMLSSCVLTTDQPSRRAPGDDNSSAPASSAITTSMRIAAPSISLASGWAAGSTPSRATAWW